MQPVYDRAMSGMQSAQQAMDVIANNIANADTPGFDAALPDIVDLVYQTVDQRNMLGASATTSIGAGSQMNAAPRSQAPGVPQSTGNPLDVLIAGEGYLQVMQPNGQIAYTRAGLFQIDSLGRFHIRGMLLQPPITVPQGAADLGIRTDGTVVVRQSSDPLVIGQMQLARFPNEQGLQAIDGTLYLPSASSGGAIVGTPGQNGYGTLQSGFIEGSRVDISREMSALIVAERSFGLNAKTLQTLDRMLGDVTKR